MAATWLIKENGTSKINQMVIIRMIKQIHQKLSVMSFAQQEISDMQGYVLYLRCIYYVMSQSVASEHPIAIPAGLSATFPGMVIVRLCEILVWNVFVLHHV